MNVKLLFKLLGILSLLIGAFMLFSLFWANPRFGQHTDLSIDHDRFESEGFQGLLYSTLISLLVGLLFLLIGRGSSGRLFRKEAMAVVGLSWVLATLLGALPFMLSGTSRGPAIRVFDDTRQVMVVADGWRFWDSWQTVEVNEEQFDILSAVAQRPARGLSEWRLESLSGHADAALIFAQLCQQPILGKWLLLPGESEELAPADRASHFRIDWVPMGIVDSMFESQSGFSTTGATVLSDLEDPYLVPHCILFWRASTQFLGGLGIIVLFVVILGQGSAGKALMRTEVPGPTQDNFSSRIQHSAWLFTGMYVGLNAILALILFLMGMSFFDAICHSFTTMATGGFSTYNASLGHFETLAATHGGAIETTVIIFMILAGTNFTLLALMVMGQPWKLFADIEFRTYLSILALATTAIVLFGVWHADREAETLVKVIRDGAFQVVSIVTTTGFITADFDQWDQFSRGLLLVLMFVGGCAGSTGGGLKVIRHVLLVKILGIEVEHSFHPKVIRHLRLGGKPVEDDGLRQSIPIYFCLVMLLFAAGFLFLLTVEPNNTWGPVSDNKLIDSASSVVSTLNNVGPGLGTVGATQNYGHFSQPSKLMFILMMMLGRLEIFPVLVLFQPSFWRDQ